MMAIAFLGLGAMGSRIAVKLLDAGFDLTVWNRDAAKTSALVGKGAKVAASPRAAVAAADIAFSMVRDDEASRSVWLDARGGALAAMKPGAIVLESSTLTLAFVHQLAAAAGAAGLNFLDAPVVGSRPQAEAKQLIHLVGGEAGTLARAEPVLRAVGGAIHHAGPVGSGMAMKLAVNALLGVQVAAVAELLGVLARQGIAGERAAEILGATPVASPAAKAAMASMVAAAYAPLFPVALVEKDLTYAAAGAQAACAETPVSRAAGAVFAAAIANGLGAEHMTAVRKVF